jgi:hypothetical protein
VNETVAMVSSFLGALSLIMLILAPLTFFFAMFGIWRRRVEDENTIREASDIFIVGPLNINKKTKTAGTVFGSPLDLDEKEFSALAMLAAYEGETVDIHTLHNKMYADEIEAGQAKDIKETRKEVMAKLASLLEKVNTAGAGFMSMTQNEKTNDYTFSTTWHRGIADVS